MGALLVKPTKKSNVERDTVEDKMRRVVFQVKGNQLWEGALEAQHTGCLAHSANKTTFITQHFFIIA